MKVAVSITQQGQGVHKGTGVHFKLEAETYYKLGGRLELLVGRYETKDFKVETLTLPRFNFKPYSRLLEWHFAGQLNKLCKKQLEKDGR